MMTNNTPVSLVQTRMRLTREDSLVEMQMRIVTRMMMPTAMGSSCAQPTSMRKALESCAAQNHPRFKTAFLHPFFLFPTVSLSFFLSCCFQLILIIQIRRREGEKASWLAVKLALSPVKGPALMAP